MRSTVLRALVAAAVVSAVGIATTTPAHAVDTVQAETGSLMDCGDDGPMVVVDNPSGIIGRYVFHPGTGCAQSFVPPGIGVYSILGIRYFMSGHSGLICGHFEVDGIVPGRTPTACALGGDIRYEAFSTNYVRTTYTITWVTDSPSPGWANAFVDHHDRLRVV